MSTAAGSFDLDQVDRLLTTTKQVRKRMDLERPVPRELLLDCIDIAQHAPMGGNLERNRWLVVDDPDLKAEIAPLVPAGRTAVPGDQRRRRARRRPAAGHRLGHLPRRPHRRGARHGHRPAAGPTAGGGELLGIPDSVTQVALLPVGFYKGSGFTPAKRRPASDHLLQLLEINDLIRRSRRGGAGACGVP